MITLKFKYKPFNKTIIHLKIRDNNIDNIIEKLISQGFIERSQIKDIKNDIKTFDGVIELLKINGFFDIKLLLN